MHWRLDRAKQLSEEKLHLQVAADLTIQKGLQLIGSCVGIPVANETGKDPSRTPMNHDMRMLCKTINLVAGSNQIDGILG